MLIPFEFCRRKRLSHTADVGGVPGSSPGNGILLLALQQALVVGSKISEDDCKDSGGSERRMTVWLIAHGYGNHVKHMGGTSKECNLNRRLLCCDAMDLRDVAFALSR